MLSPSCPTATHTATLLKAILGLYHIVNIKQPHENKHGLLAVCQQNRQDIQSA